MTNSQASTELIINNRYTIKDLVNDKLGEGGIGVVYKALDLKASNESQPFVVVKLLHQGLIHDRWVINKFEKEAQAIVEKIKHIGVVEGKESGVLPDGRPYLVMEYIKGESLRDLVKRNTEGVDLERSANILKQFGDALTAIHKANIYHRDLKPDNIMLCFNDKKEECIKIIDFGIATVKESTDEKTKTTQVAGTPVYMAPEQIMEGKPTAKSDIYAMGIIAYELLTGRRPFTVEAGENAYISLYQQQMAGLKNPAKQLRRKLSDEVDNLIKQALEFEQNNRFDSAEEFGNKLYKALLESVEDSTKKSDLPNFVTKVPAQITSNQQVSSPLSTTDVKPQSKNHLIIIVGLILIVGITGLITKNFLISDSTLNKPTPVATNSPTTPNNNQPANKLNYSVELTEFRDGKYQSPSLITGASIIVHDKDKILFDFGGEQAGYVYMLNQSPKDLDNGVPKYNVLFPGEKEVNQLSANQIIKLPSKDEPIVITGATGLEKFWIIWSKEQIQELESLRILLSPKEDGVVKDPTKAIFIKQLLEKYSSDKLVKTNEDKEAGQMHSTSSENVIAILTEITHR